MKSRWSLVALGCGAYLAFSVVSFPASVAFRWFAPDELALASIEGTIWRGSAAYGGMAGVSVSDLRWQVHPSALLTGSLGLTVESRLSDGFIRSRVLVSAGRIIFENLTASTRLASFGALLPVPEASGQLSVNLDRVELVDGWPVDASGVVRIADLEAPPLLPVPGVSVIPLGNYVARVTTAGGGSAIVAAVSDEGAPLELEGRADLGSDRAYRLEARVTPRADAVSALVDGLRFIGQANSGGQYQIEFSGSL